MHHNKIVEMRKLFGNLEVGISVPLQGYSHCECAELQDVKRDLFSTC